MLERVSGQFIIDGQVEDILGGVSGAARIARISQSCRFSGQLEGESMAEFTAVLPRDGDGSFHGFQRVTGTLGEREGSFVLSVTGEYVKGQPRGSWTIVPKSGSGDLGHIRGGGTFSLPDGKPGTYRLEFDLRKPRAARAPLHEAAEAPVVVPVADVAAVPATVIEAAVPMPRKPARKPTARKAEPVAAVVTEAPAKRYRPRKTASNSVVASDQPANRTRARKTDPATSDPPVAAPASTPKRARKAHPSEPRIESATAAAIQEPIATKSPRGKKAAPPEPVALPVTESAPRKRGAKAA